MNMCGSLADIDSSYAIKNYSQSLASSRLRITEYDIECLRSIEKLLTENLAQHFTIVSLAREFGINEFKLKAAFREVYGNSIYDYQLQMRIVKAEELLLTTERQIKEVAKRIGYRSSSSFIAAFKKVNKTSPALWKRKYTMPGNDCPNCTG